MELTPRLYSLGISLALGLLIGVQRERSDPAIAGIRTFPLIAILGTLCAMLAESFGGWILGVGLVGVAAASAMGNYLRSRAEQSPGITTEVAILVMFVVGAMVWTGPKEVAIAAGVTTAILLALKAPMHALASRVTEQDLRAVLQFAAVTFIVLPILPDKGYGPLGALNPHQIWLMVVLVVGISLAAYAVYKLIPTPNAAVIAGLLGGLISSTATTMAAARRVREQGKLQIGGGVVIIMASAVVFLRVLVEIAVVGEQLVAEIATPIAVMAVAVGIVSLSVWLISRRRLLDPVPQSNPTELKSALVFAGLYAAVLLAVALARQYADQAGFYAVALLSGLTDMDAITLSTTRLAVDGHVDPALAWRAIIAASMSNMLFKGGIVLFVGGRELFKPVAACFGTQIAVGLCLILFWG